MIDSSILQVPLPKRYVLCSVKQSSVDELAGQGTMETYRCVYEILPFVATVANRGRSRCTGQDNIVTSGYMKQLPWPAIFETAAAWHDNDNWQNLLQQLCENSLVCGLCPLPSW
jgi:hypothetical protein